MINVSPAFLNEMYQNDNRRFTYQLDVSLADGTTLTLLDADLNSDGVSVEDSMSRDEMLEVGNATINQATIILQNYEGQWDDEDFTDAQIVINIGLTIDGTTEWVQKGIFTVTEQQYQGAILTLTAMDRMSQFDVDFLENSTLTFPCTVLQAVEEACTFCNVPLADTGFPGSEIVLEKIPPSQGMTFRTLISWAAMLGGCNARVNRFGQLEFLYYDFETLAWFDQDNIEGWANEISLLTESGNNLITESDDEIIVDNSRLNVFPSLYSLNTAANDTTITGVKVCVEDNDAETLDDALATYLYGTDDYLITLENNFLINKQNAQQIAEYVGQRLVGKSYRKASFSHLGDPLAEAGDVAVILDGKGRMFRVLVSSTTFTANDRQSTVSAGENPPRVVTSSPANRSVGAATPMLITGKNAQRYSAQTEAYLRTIRAIQPKLDSMGGLYETEVETSGGGKVRYLHNKKELSESNIQIVVSSNGIHVTANALDDEPTWYGMTVDGDFITRILSATGINADWIDSGAFVIRDDNNVEIFRADKTGKIFRWNMDYSSMSDDGNLTIYDKDGNASFQVSASRGSLVRGSTITSSSIETTDGVDIEGMLSSSYHLAKMTPDGIWIRFTDLTLQTNFDILKIVSKKDDADVATNSGLIINGYSLEDRVGFTLDAASASTASLSKPSSVTNFTFSGSTWTCGVRKKSGVVTLHYNFTGYFSGSGTSGGTIFTLPSGYRPATTMYMVRVNESGVRYRLTLNTSGAVTLSNYSGSAGSSAQGFRDVVTFVNA